MIGIIDTDSKNIGSILNCLKYLKIKNIIIKNINEIDKKISHIILPGVGNFQNVAQTLFSNNFEKKKLVEIINKKKTLAICVGMQILFNKSEESNIPGLNYFDGEIKSLKNLKCKDTIPHIGFNSLKLSRDTKLNFFKKKDFYFVHSFALSSFNFKEIKEKYIIGKTSHGNVDFISLILTSNLIATQFHPEKSGNTGIELFKYFYGKKKSYI